MLKFLVTGGAGFIGSHIVKHLLKLNNVKVVVLDNLKATKNLSKLAFIPQILSDKFTFIKGDIRNYDTCIKALEGVNYVLHQGALGSVPRSFDKPSEYHDNNVVGTDTLFKACAYMQKKENNLKRIIQASSSSVYGDIHILPKNEEIKPKPKSPYAETKLKCEELAEKYKDLDIISLRYFNVFGENQSLSDYSAVFPAFFNAIKENKPLTIHGDGQQTRDFTFVKNVVNVNVYLALKGSKHSILNVGQGNSISINQLAKKIIELSDKEVHEIIYTNKRKIIYTNKRNGDVRDTLACTKRLSKSYNIDDFINFNIGLALTAEFYLNEKHYYNKLHKEYHSYFFAKGIENGS